MKHIYLFFLLLLTSTTPWAGAADLEILSPSADSQILLLNTGGRSCRAQVTDPEGPDDIGGVVLPVGRIGLVWKGAAPLKLSDVRITWEGESVPGGSQTRVLPFPELSYLWSGRAGVPELLPSEQPQFSSPECFLQLRGPHLTQLSQPAFGYGTLSVSGTTIRDGLEVPVHAESRFQFHFDGLDLY